MCHEVVPILETRNSFYLAENNCHMTDKNCIVIWLSLPYSSMGRVYISSVAALLPERFTFAVQIA